MIAARSRVLEGLEIIEQRASTWFVAFLRPVGIAIVADGLALLANDVGGEPERAGERGNLGLALDVTLDAVPHQATGTPGPSALGESFPARDRGGAQLVKCHPVELLTRLNVALQRAGDAVRVRARVPPVAVVAGVAQDFRRGGCLGLPYPSINLRGKGVANF